MPDSVVPKGQQMNSFVKLTTKLNNYFLPRKIKHQARFVFLKMKPNSDEPIVAYAARCREKANECEFGDGCN